MKSGTWSHDFHESAGPAPVEAASVRRAPSGLARWPHSVGLGLRMNVLMTLLMVAFALAVVRMNIEDTRSSVREEIQAGTKVTVQMLGAMAFASQVTRAPQHFLPSVLERLGRVRANHVRLWDKATGSLVYEAPPSVYKAGRYAPAWYARLVDPGIGPVNIDLPGARIEVIPDASRAVLDAWDDLQRLVLLWGAFFVVVNVLVFGFSSRWIHRITRALGEAMAESQEAEARLRANQEFAGLVRLRVEEERRRIATELHDELAQCVTAIRTMARSILQAPAPPQAHASARSIDDIAARLYDAVHAIARRLRPPELDALGLAQTLESSLAAWNARNPGIGFELEIAGNVQDLGDVASITVYRLVHEALTNVVRHAGATRAVVRVAREDARRVVVTVTDDGHGQVDLGAAAAGLGITGMRERVVALHGTFSVEGRPGAGTEVRAVIPVEAAAS